MNSSDTELDTNVGAGYTIILVLTSFIILTLNVPIVVLLVAGKFLGKSIRNIHILSLSISDTLVGINVIPISIILKSIVQGNPPSYQECWSRMCLYLTCLIASFFHVLFICLDRCGTILRKSLSSKRNTRLRFCAMVLLSWICAITIIVVPFLVLKNDREIPYCSISTVFNPKQGAIVLRIWSLLFLHGFILAFAACVWMATKIISVGVKVVQPPDTTTEFTQTTSNIHIIQVAPMNDIHGEERGSSTTQKSTSTTSNPRQIKISRSQKSAIKTISLLALSMMVCLVPMNIMILVEGFYGFSIFSSNQRHIIIYIASVNSAVNPIIYAFRIHEVRQTIRLLKQKISCCHIYCVYQD
ncbi:uncharacterized protein LOC143050206 [Mytilus galloprovincialis]|uniref:uncharacterized protein LOC143050206 n=1 Tax=Mytilus galloprovincialis TaxID=29158 RepID=UPI003F7BA207